MKEKSLTFFAQIILIIRILHYIYSSFDDYKYISISQRSRGMKVKHFSSFHTTLTLSRSFLITIRVICEEKDSANKDFLRKVTILHVFVFVHLFANVVIITATLGSFYKQYLGPKDKK